MNEGVHKFNLGEQKLFTLTERTLQKKSTVGARIQSGMNRAFMGHRVMETENIRAGRDLGNSLALGRSEGVAWTYIHYQM